jgi:thiol-disulfide isomerase/thioredoxin
MKKSTLIIILFTSIFAFAQETIKSAENYIKEISKNNANDTIVKIYSTDLKTLDEILKNKEKTVVVYSFSILCKFSRERFPIIKEILENKKNVDLIIVTTNRFDEIGLMEKYFKHYKYYSPIFILDTNIYDNQKDPSKRNDLMVKYLCKDCDPYNMGFSSFFIKSLNNEILYKSVYETTIEEMKEVLLKFD